MKVSQVNVLYVEDDAADVVLAQTAMKDVGFSFVKMDIVVDGEQALKYLKRQNSYENVPKPDLVLLDLNLPKIHGTEVLRTMKQDGVLQRIPVVVFSTSRNQPDIDETYHLGACGYFTKASDYLEYKDIIRTIGEYWGKRAVLPSK